MAGTWTGGGTIELTNDIQEKLRCRASYTHGQGNSSLALSIRCASDNYKFELTSNVVERGGQISGQWNETGLRRLRLDQRPRQRRPHFGGRREATASRGLSAATTSGNRQSVTITPQATYIINVQIAMGLRGSAGDHGAKR